MADPSHSSATASDALPASATPAHLPAAALLASATPAHPPHADLPAAALLASAVDTDALHAGHVASAAATDAPDAGFPAASTDPDMRFGFESEELGKEKTVGTVEERDLFVCYMGPEAWPSHLEATKSDRLPHLLAAAIKARKPEMMKLTELTICEEEGTESSLGDVLIFPDMIRYRGLTCSNVNTFVEEVLVKDADWHDGILEAIRGSYVFVCCHESKDNKCGASGPALIRKFKEGIEAQGLGPQVIVRSCAHLGGHECLGTVIIFSSDAKGEVTGHWYGYVSPDDVNLLLNKHMGQNETGEHIGRGQLGLSEEKNMEALELKRVKNGITVLKEAGTWTGGEDNLVCSLKDIMDLSSEEENLEIDFSKLKGTEAMLLAALAGDRVPQQVPPCPDAIRSESVAAVPLENIDVTTDVAKSNDMPPLEDSFANPVHENNGDDSTEDNGTIDEGPHIADVTVAIQRSEVEVLLQQAPSHQTAIIPQNANNENGAAEVNGHNTDGLEEENGGSEVPSAADRTILQRSEVAVQLQQAPSHQIAIIPQSAAAVPGASDSVDDMPPLEDDFGNIMKANNENGAAEVNGHNTDGLKEDNGRDEVPPAANTTILQIEHIQDPNAADPTDLRNGIIKRKLLIPANFNGEAVLDRSDLHKVRTAQELRNIIENTSGWLSTRISLALLVNGRVFQIPAHSVTDNLYTKAGAVCVVRGEELLHVHVDNRLYTRSRTAELSERRPQNSQISDMVIVKHEFRGNLWARRRYSVEGDDEYHLLQWLPKVADTKVKLQTKTQQVEEEAPVDDFSIKKCIAVVTTIEELSIDEKVGSFDIFKDENNRAIFLCADPDARLLWLRKQLSRVT